MPIKAVYLADTKGKSVFDDSRGNLPREGEAAIGIPKRRVDKTRITEDLSIERICLAE